MEQQQPNSVFNDLVKIIPQTLSILACLYLFYSYKNLHTKSIGIKMIFILSLSDLAFHCGVVIGTFVPSVGVQAIGNLMANIFLRFSIFWASSMSYFLYKLLSAGEDFNQAGYPKKSFAALFTLSCILTFL